MSSIENLINDIDNMQEMYRATVPNWPTHPSKNYSIKLSEMNRAGKVAIKLLIEFCNKYTQEEYRNDSNLRVRLALLELKAYGLELTNRYNMNKSNEIFAGALLGRFAPSDDHTIFDGIKQRLLTE